ncbi:MAG: hypothetical protein AAGM22_20585 [Acidobacteriota bacterium]
MFKMIEIKGRSARRPLWLPALFITLLLSAPVAGAEGAFTTVPEMAPLPDVVAFKAVDRRQLAKDASVAPALEAATRHAESLWPALRRLDLVELSRWHIEPTKGFVLPEEPAFEARVLGREDDGSLHVDLKGPRLPANFDIVHRHLHVIAVVRPGGAVEGVTATIRLRIYE